MVNTLKIVFTGTMGAGKTTAICNLSDTRALMTEVPITDGTGSAGKQSTTVGFDYGETKLDETLLLKLYGTPGQERFRFMWDILAKGAFGLIVLADNSRPDPIGDVVGYLEAFRPHVPLRRTVIGVGRTETHASPSIDDYCVQLQERGFDVPVIATDAREPDNVRLLLSILVSMAEVD